MTTWNRTHALYLNVTKPTSPLLDLKTNSPGETPTLILGDHIPLHLYFRSQSEGSNPSTVAALPVGSVIVVSCKRRGLLFGSLNLFFSDAFASAGAGDDLRYEGVLDLNTSNLANAFQGEEQISARMEIEIQNSGNTARTSFQFEVTLLRQVYAGEGVPVSGDPVYPPPSQILINNHSEVAIGSGVSQVVVSGLALDYTPATVLAWVTKPAGGSNILAVVDHDSIDDDGFTADLTGATPAAGYQLHYLLIKETA